MSKINPRKLGRIIDANFNRAKEGLRVCEDICRFFMDDASKTRQFKTIRHQLSEIICTVPLENLIRCRDIEGDVGKGSTQVELARKDVSDLLYANLQRIKESLRVLEEFLKIVDIQRAKNLKELRYRVYALEKKVISAWKK